MNGTQLRLDRTWTMGDRIAGGGFGQVYVVTSDDGEAVAKLVPKAPGADRELLFIKISDVRNVVPIIDSGEHEGYWVLVMPRAEMSLRQHLDSSGGLLALADAVEALKDICDTLTDLAGKVVHRDLKPENVLRLNGHWCLADFGISRYAEATTAPDTHKFALSPLYAAPERWRSERATSATDVYAVGVMAYEMVAGYRPFPGPTIEQFREQHLHQDPPELKKAPTALGALVDECLYKAPEARPGAANVRARLDRVAQQPQSAGLKRLEEANREQVRRQGDTSWKQSEARTSLNAGTPWPMLRIEASLGSRRHCEKQSRTRPHPPPCQLPQQAPGSSASTRSSYRYRDWVWTTDYIWSSKARGPDGRHLASTWCTPPASA